MVSGSPPVAFNTMKTCARACAALFALLLAAGPGAADELSPYTATYQTSLLGMKVNLNRNLKRSADGTYTLTSAGKVLVAGLHEVSVFRVKENRVVPKSFVYQVTGLANRRREVHFTPGSDTIRSLYKGQWYNLPYTEATLDRMSQQEQLRLSLLNDPTPGEDMTIRVADGKRVKDYQLVYRGEETLDTPLGKVDTLHFERVHDDPDRQSDTWVAPAWDYLMVKTVHVEDGKPTELMITGGTIGDQPLSAD